MIHCLLDPSFFYTPLSLPFSLLLLLIIIIWFRVLEIHSNDCLICHGDSLVT